MNNQTLPVRLTIPEAKRVSIPRKFIFFDTETVSERLPGCMIRHRLKLGHAIYWQREREDRPEVLEDHPFTDAADFWQWVTDKVHNRETLHIIAHNVSFDFLVLEGFTLLPVWSFTMSSVYHKFSTTVIRFDNGKKRLVFSDLMNFYPVKLAEIGQAVGLEKKTIDFESCTLDGLADYCKRDTEIVYHAIRRLTETLQDNDLGSFRVTGPSTAHQIYRHRFMPSKIVTTHYPQVVAFEREAYTGGYVAVSKLLVPGSPMLAKLDVNAMYPSVMADKPYPVQLLEFAGRVSLVTLGILLKSHLVLARVTVNAKAPLYPCRYASGVCYPVGQFDTVITTPLLRYALEHDELAEVHQIAVYEPGEIFDEYVRYMYGQRIRAKEAGDRAGELFYKTMCNSVYGKFAQSATKTEVVGTCDVDEFQVFSAYAPDTKEEWKELHAGGSIIWIHQAGESRWSFFAIAAHVTDYARLKLFDLTVKAGRDHVFYCDTDSIITDDVGMQRVYSDIQPGVMGRLKVEGSGSLFAGFAKKDYLLGDSRVVKGVDPKELTSEAHVFKHIEHLSFMGAARRSLSDGAFWKEGRKRHNPYLRDIEVMPDGLVIPIRLPQDSERLGHQTFTLPIIRGLATKILSDRQRLDFKSWLE